MKKLQNHLIWTQDQPFKKMINFKKQRNACVKLKKKAIAKDFSEASSDLKKNSKPFYAKIKPYMTTQPKPKDLEVLRA